MLIANIRCMNECERRIEKNHKFNWKKCLSSNIVQHITNSYVTKQRITQNTFFFICRIICWVRWYFLRYFSLIVDFVSCARRWCPPFAIVIKYSLNCLSKKEFLYFSSVALCFYFYFSISATAKEYRFYFGFWIFDAWFWCYLHFLWVLSMCAYAVQTYVDLAKVHYTVGGLVLHKTTASRLANGFMQMLTYK